MYKYIKWATNEHLGGLKMFFFCFKTNILSFSNDQHELIILNDLLYLLLIMLIISYQDYVFTHGFNTWTVLKF